MCFSKRHHGKNFEGHRYRRKGPGSIIGFIVRAFILKLLWNMLIPSLFGGPVIGFFHALGLLLLGKVITGGPGFRGRGPRGKSREWKRKMKEKMENMTPEERREFKDKMLGWEVNVIEVEDEDTEDEDSDKGKKKK